MMGNVGKKTYYKNQKGLNVRDKGNCSHWRNQAFLLVSHRKPALRSSEWRFYQRADGKINGISVYQVTISFWRINFQAVSPYWSQPCIRILTVTPEDTQSIFLFFFNLCCQCVSCCIWPGPSITSGVEKNSWTSQVVLGLRPSHAPEWVTLDQMFV